jgi:hypothetical protein
MESSSILNPLQNPYFLKKNEIGYFSKFQVTFFGKVLYTMGAAIGQSY